MSSHTDGSTLLTLSAVSSHSQQVDGSLTDCRPSDFPPYGPDHGSSWS